MPCEQIGDLHICRSGGEWGPWQKIRKNWPATLLTDCCVCRMPKGECEIRWFMPPPDSYYEPHNEVRCRKGKGCSANPRRKIGWWNRRAMFDGPLN